jgi:ComF family protein
VHRVKFSRRSDLGLPLGQLLARAWLANLPERPDFVMAVPLSSRRLAERGFNQSSALARAVARSLTVPARAGVLRRCRDTVAQSSLGRAERAVNLAGSFQVVVPRQVRARSILVVDDVITTGATFDEIVSALQTNGARKVECIALARAGRD